MNLTAVKLVAPHGVGSGSFLLESGGSAIVLPATITVTTARTYSGGTRTQTTYPVSFVSGNRVFVGAATVGSDQAFAIGDLADVDLSGGASSNVIDAAFGSTRGSVLYRGSSGWTILIPGSSGQAIVSNGAGADPSYQNVSTLGSIADQRVLANVSGDSAAPSANTLTAIVDACLGSTRGSVLYRGASGWAILTPGTAGKALCSNGTGADPSYQNVAGSGTVNSGTASRLAYYATTGTAVSDQSKLTIGADGQLNVATQAVSGTPLDGDIWWDTTQKCFSRRQSGNTIFGPDLIFCQNANVTDQTTGAQTLLSTTGATGTLALAAGFLNVTNRSLLIQARGQGTTAGSGQGNFTFAVKFGSTVVSNNGVVGLTASRTNSPWALDLLITTKTTGASGTIDCFGWVTPFAGVGSSLFGQTVALGNATAATTYGVTPVTIDLTAAYTLDFTMTLSAGSASTLITCSHFLVRVLG